MRTFNILKIDTDIWNEYEEEREILLKYPKHYLFLNIEQYKRKGFSDENILKVEKMLGREEIDEEALKQYKDFVSKFDNYKL